MRSQFELKWPDLRPATEREGFLWIVICSASRSRKGSRNTFVSVQCLKHILLWIHAKVGNFSSNLYLQSWAYFVTRFFSRRDAYFLFVFFSFLMVTIQSDSVIVLRGCFWTQYQSVSQPVNQPAMFLVVASYFQAVRLSEHTWGHCYCWAHHDCKYFLEWICHLFFIPAPTFPVEDSQEQMPHQR